MEKSVGRKLKKVLLMLIMVMAFTTVGVTAINEDVSATSEWSDAYEQFVMTDRGYLSDLIKDDYRNPATFALWDMNGDGTPELIVGDGWTSGTYGFGYCYTYTNGKIVKIEVKDSLETYGGTFGAHISDTVPGLFTCVWERGEYTAGGGMLFKFYHYKYIGGYIVKELVMTQAEGRYSYTRVTSDVNLYNAAVKAYNNDTVLTLYRKDIIESLSWNIFTLAGNKFLDIKESAYYFYPVLWATGNGYTSGTSATAFSPNATCTRGQVVTFLWRVAGCPVPHKSANPFVDVKPSDYFYEPVLWAIEKGITSGVDKTHFAPNQGCTRGQVVSFLWRAEGEPKVESFNYFKDVAAGQYYYTPVLWALQRYITSGTSNSTFSPNNICTRGQIVTFLYRAYGDLFFDGEN